MNFVLLIFGIVFSSTNLIGLLYCFIEEELIILENKDYSFKEFTVLDFIIFPFVGIGGLIYFISSKLSNFGNIFKVKPFKKTSFRVGERVLCRNKEYVVCETEKTLKGNDIRLKLPNDYLTTLVDASEVRKISKLEKALK